MSEFSPQLFDLTSSVATRRAELWTIGADLAGVPKF